MVLMYVPLKNLIVWQFDIVADLTLRCCSVSVNHSATNPRWLRLFQDFRKTTL